MSHSVVCASACGQYWALGTVCLLLVTSCLLPGQVELYPCCSTCWLRWALPTVGKRKCWQVFAEVCVQVCGFKLLLGAFAVASQVLNFCMKL